MSENEGTEAVEATEEKAKGRPRPAATLELDERVFKFLEDNESTGGTGVTKETLADALETPANKIYLALYRLRVADRVHKVRESRTAVWKVGTAPEQPVESTEAPAEV